MNWETYRLMTKEQKEEYQYKFIQKPFIISMNSFITPMLIFTLSMSLVLCSLYINFKEGLITKDLFTAILQKFSYYIYFCVAIIFLISLWKVITMVMRLFKEKKWIRENNIEIQEGAFKRWLNKLFKKMDGD